MIKVLITGVHGFCGRHLARHLTAQGVEVYGVSRTPSAESHWRAQEPFTVSALTPIIRAVQPHYVFHLAGVSSSAEPAVFYSVNVGYAAALLQALKEAGYWDCPVLLVGTAAEYGNVSEAQLPVTEDHPPQPYNHYGVSKLAQTHLGLAEIRQGRPLIIVRPFNIIGPGMPDHLVVQSFAWQIAAIRRRQRPEVMQVGNLQSARDFVDVMDLVDIYWRLAQTPAAYGEIFNICSGAPVPIRDVLQKMTAMTDARITVEVDPDRFKAIDVPVHYGSVEKLQRFLGVAPGTPLDVSLKRILDTVDNEL